MREPTYKEHKKLVEIEEVYQIGRNGDEEDMEMIWEMVRGDQLRNLVSLGRYDWIFKLTEEAEEYLEENS